LTPTHEVGSLFLPLGGSQFEESLDLGRAASYTGGPGAPKPGKPGASGRLAVERRDVTQIEKAGVPPIAHDDVVSDRYAEEAAGLYQLPGHLTVGR
jgi:hypothetical protein